MSSFIGGVAVGVGLGYLNATFFGLPGWANILVMTVFMIPYVLGQYKEAI